MQNTKPEHRPSGKSDAAETPTRSQTLVRGLNIVNAVADAPASIAEIAMATGLTYATVHRIVSVLVEQRYLKTTDARLVALGPRLIELGFAAHAQMDLVRQARPWLETLARKTRDTIHLARLEDGEVSYLDKLSGTRAVEISSRIGGRKPAISTGVGKALILDRSNAQLTEMYRRDHHLMNYPIPLEEWSRRMESYRTGDYAFDLGEDEASIRCVAAPVRDATRRIIASISVSSTVDYMDETRMRALVDEVRSAAAGISANLGYHGPRG
ncbi:IclR family transcriptional regulator [Pseudogemmobacter sonorensis]|uniref:IclR family transcriptional regulator n=1 Tax=Pseudogemmobacter sonorensis TaxID=2989681 RepID=UPI00369880D3